MLKVKLHSKPEFDPSSIAFGHNFSKKEKYLTHSQKLNASGQRFFT
jgi:hypothetical protein